MRATEFVILYVKTAPIRHIYMEIAPIHVRTYGLCTEIAPMCIDSVVQISKKEGIVPYIHLHTPQARTGLFERVIIARIVTHIVHTGVNTGESKVAVRLAICGPRVHAT